MFKRLIFDDSAVIFTIAAFITAVTIYVAIFWRAIRMPRRQIEELSQLPFNNDSDQPRHDTNA